MHLVPVPVPGDGDCLFRSLQHQALFLGGGGPWADKTRVAAAVPDVMSMRRLLAEFIRSHASLFGPFLELEKGEASGAALSSEAERVAAYCTALARSYEVWGSHVELVAAATLFDTAIDVVTADRVERCLPSTTRESSAAPTTCTAAAARGWTVVLYQHQYALGAHYDPTTTTARTRTSVRPP